MILFDFSICEFVSLWVNYPRDLLHNVCRHDGCGYYPRGLCQVDSDGRQHGGIIASDCCTLIIQIAKVADISDVTGRIAVGTHKPEGVATIARDR